MKLPGQLEYQKPSRFLAILLASVACTNLMAQKPAGRHATALTDNATAAIAWRASLTDAQQAKCLFEFGDKERENWHFFPKVRAGLPLNEMTADQQELAMKMLQATLSDEGIKQSQDVMMLESVLADLEKRPEFRDPKKYYVAIFGDPADDSPWGWRFEGHHLSLNFCSIDNALASSTPAFLGTNPATVATGPHKGMRPLGREEDLGRQLVNSLNPAQRARAVIADVAPDEILTGAESVARLDSKAGLAVDQLNAEQTRLLHQLVDSYFTRFAADRAAVLQKRLQADYDSLLFAWAGDSELGKPHYYRIIGKHLLIEYDNTQNNANHAHSVLRYFDNDFGRDVLKEHYEHHHTDSTKHDHP